MLTALRHPGCAGQQRRLPGHGQPLARPRPVQAVSGSPERQRGDGRCPRERSSHAPEHLS